MMWYSLGGAHGCGKPVKKINLIRALTVLGIMPVQEYEKFIRNWWNAGAFSPEHRRNACYLDVAKSLLSSLDKLCEVEHQEDGVK